MKWKVCKVGIRLFPHHNADKLEVGRVGDYQVVVQKGLYADGDTVVFAPEKSVLTGAIREEFAKYLRGPSCDRVGQARLRGEVSCGIIIPPHLCPDLSAFADGEDVSTALGITKYRPTIPAELLGAVEECPVESYAEHEVYHLGSYRSEFVHGERVIATEKVHGSQCACIMDRSGRVCVSSKGLLDEGLSFQDGESNLYTRGADDIGVRERLGTLMGVAADIAPSVGDVMAVQVFGKAFPCNSGYSYGRTRDNPSMVVFRTVIIGASGKFDVPHDHPSNPFAGVMVPVAYDGPFDADGVRAIDAARKGRERVSGRELHIKEGLVLRPYDNRRAGDARYLIVKHINPDYSETGDELS